MEFRREGIKNVPCSNSADESHARAGDLHNLEFHSDPLAPPPVVCQCQRVCVSLVSIQFNSRAGRQLGQRHTTTTTQQQIRPFGCKPPRSFAGPSSRKPDPSRGHSLKAHQQEWTPLCAGELRRWAPFAVMSSQR